VNGRLQLNDSSATWLAKISSGHTVGKSLLYEAAYLNVNQCRYSGDSGDQQ